MEMRRILRLLKVLVMASLATYCAPTIQLQANHADEPKNVTVRQLPKPTPPGSATVAATIISIDTLNGQISITCLIDEILGYGAGSPVIIPKTTISAGIVPGFHYVIPEVKQSVVIDMRHIMRPDKGGKSQDVIWQITWIEPDGN